MTGHRTNALIKSTFKSATKNADKMKKQQKIIIKNPLTKKANRKKEKTKLNNTTNK